MSEPVRASRRKFHIIYKTTCLVTGRYYIGMHSTDDLEDGYIGSGQVLWKSIKKYGKEQHHCEILEYLQHREALALREEELVNPDTLKDPLCMNLRTGGTGNYPGVILEEITRQKMSESQKKRHKDMSQEMREEISQKISEALKETYAHPESLERLSAAAKQRWCDQEYRDFHVARAKGREHTEEAKQKMSLAKTGKTLLRTVEHNQKIGAAHRGKPKNIEHTLKAKAKRFLNRYGIDPIKMLMENPKLSFDDIKTVLGIK